MTPITAAVLGIINKIVPDTKEGTKLKTDLATKHLDLLQTETEAAARVVIAEAQGGWLQRNWRPLLMLVAILIIANNYLIAPYSWAFGFALPILELPDRLWGLLTIGVGGYVAGRSAEKIMKDRNSK